MGWFSIYLESRTMLYLANICIYNYTDIKVLYSTCNNEYVGIDLYDLFIM